MNRQLAQLAKIYGIQTSYRNIDKQRVEARVETILLTLAALGAPVRSMDDVPKTLAEETARARRPGVASVIVAWNGKAPPGGSGAHRGRKPFLIDEQERETTWPSGPSGTLSPGYYRLIARDDGKTAETLVIAAPSQARFPFADPTWGVFAPAYALRSERGRAAGDLTDFESFADWILARGGRIAATLPLLAGFFDAPFDASPYAPVSRLFWNEFYADPRRTEEFPHSIDSAPAAVEGGDSRLIDYRRVMARRRSVLEDLARQFFMHADAPRRRAFERFQKENPGLDDYARFRAVVDRNRSGWRTWPAPLRNGTITPDDYDKADYDYHRYAQWIVQDQLRNVADRIHENGGGLYLDMPLGLHMDGYDTWRYPELFVKSMAAGAPPDPVSREGQHWGFQPLDPRAMRADHYRYTIAGIRNHLKYARLTRIDHVIGLHRQYWIPDGVSKSEGVYVTYPAEELYAVLCLESHRNNAGIVGEDLGTVPAGVRSTMRGHHIQRLYALQYEIIDAPGAARLRPPPRGAVSCLNTHDMPPFRSFLDGRDIADRIRLGFLDEAGARAERIQRASLRRTLARFLSDNGLVASRKASSMELFEACLEFLGSSRSTVALVNVEDLWQETDPQNVPATTGAQRPNWRRRMKRTLEEISNDTKITAILHNLDRARRKRKQKQPQTTDGDTTKRHVTVHQRRSASV